MNTTEFSSSAFHAPWVSTNAAQSLRAVFNINGSLRHLSAGDVAINLFPATELESGPGNLVLRLRNAAGVVSATPLLGAAAPGRAYCDGQRFWVQGQWQDLAYTLELVLAEQATAWFWHLSLTNHGTQAQQLDVVLLQDLALAPWAAVRLNEAYVSQYLDHQPLPHPQCGVLMASRQNQPVSGRVPWVLSGSLGTCVAWATDVRQVFGMAGAGLADPAALLADLPAQRWQHEHSLVALQDQTFELAAGQSTQRGFFGLLQADHAAASGPADADLVQSVLALPEARWTPPNAQVEGMAGRDPRSLFGQPQAFAARQPDVAKGELQAWFPGAWRHLETGAQGEVHSFFVGHDTHVVTQAKEQLVMRPHGHLLRSGCHWTPDERALTSTVWMAGVFHSSLTQGHASANRVLSNLRGHLGFNRAQGLRIFVDAGEGWRLLHRPSAMAMTPQRCTWHYRSDAVHVVVTAEAAFHEPEVHLGVEVVQGGPLRVLVVHHVALNGEDGLGEGGVCWCEVGGALRLEPVGGSEMAQRFPGGAFLLKQREGVRWDAACGDEVLFADGRSRNQPYLCLRYDAVQSLGLTLRGELFAQAEPAIQGDVVPADDAVSLIPAATTPAAQADALHTLGDWLPWLGHNALVHYLAPRGLEQYSGGGWGTRDVCQGPAELLASLGRHDALRNVLLRVFSAQNADGDWPQWFMFFPRDAHIRAGDSHGDVVFWPLLALADYLGATGDASLLDEVVPYHGKDAAGAPVTAPIAAHVERALGVIRARRIEGTELAAYGHGDWNDALQPADPALRDHLCSSWTVTLHVRMLRAWVAAYTRLGRADQALAMQTWADAVVADFQRLLVVDDVVAGYASFENPARIDHLLHPVDQRTGIHYSALPMVHAIIDELFTPEQAQTHAALIADHLSGPDGLRLFDKPLRYTGGTMQLFQRGESASYFGREIGLMYMHLHLRYAEALAHLGQADAFLHALRLANPIALQKLVPQAAPRQANCYYSSSDAAFLDREQAFDHYDDIATGRVALEGGWRVYSSGAGIVYKLVVQKLLGLTEQSHQLLVDPVISPSLDGLQARLALYGQRFEVRFKVGPQGFGPQRVVLNGVSLPLNAQPNRYRTGAASIAMGAVRGALRLGVNVLEVEVG